MQLPEVVTGLLDHGLELIYGLRPLVEPTVVLGMYDRDARQPRAGWPVVLHDDES